MIKWFKDIKESDFLSVGGKAYNLAKMYNNNINVPNGFVITSEVYDNFVNSNNINLKIKKIVDSINIDNKSEKIKLLFTVESLDIKLKEELKNKFNELSSFGVAVRSSSTAEDLKDSSFAGQYNTYLNVTEDNLFDKVLLCYKSLWNERAISYRKKNNVKENFSFSIVIQEMIESEVSGVVFTANPINGIRNELIVNSSYGLGEAIVSGEVNPDQYTILKKESLILKSEINLKKVGYKYSKTGIDLYEIDSSIKEKSSLNEEQLLRLLKSCTIVEDYFQSPQDIEFAFDTKGEIYILQSRNITTLIPIDGLKHDGKLRAYFSAGTILFGMKEPFTPLGYDIISEMFPTIINTMTVRKKPLTTDFVSYISSRVYVDMTYLLSSKFVGKQFGKALSGNDLPFGDVVYNIIDKYGKFFTKQGIKFKIPFGIFKYMVPTIKNVMTAKKISIYDRHDEVIKLADNAYNQQKEIYNALKTINEKIEYAKQTLRDAFKLSQTQSMYLLEGNNIVKVNKQLKKMYGDRFNTDILIQSLPRCITQELAINLNLAAKYFYENNISEFKNEEIFIAIIKKFGSRGNMELDFGSKRWSEDPSYLINLINSYMENKMYERNLKDFEDKKNKVEVFIDEVHDAVLKDYSKKKADKLKYDMIAYRIAAGMRERPKFDIVRIANLGRQAIKSIGELYVEEGYLDSSDDIFFLRTKEMLKVKELKNLVEINKEIYFKEMKRTSIPRVILNNGEVYYSSRKISSSSNMINGISLSPGIYEGIIRIVNNPLDSELKEGEILVTESTNPSWTPLFAIAGALIMEYGGPMSHGGVVAREYGLPAVVGISTSDSNLKNGDRVIVNGELGTVEKI